MSKILPTQLFLSLGLASTADFPDAPLGAVLLRGDLDPQALAASCFIFSVSKGSADGASGFQSPGTIT